MWSQGGGPALRSPTGTPAYRASETHYLDREEMCRLANVYPENGSGRAASAHEFMYR